MVDCESTVGGSSPSIRPSQISFTLIMQYEIYILLMSFFFISFGSLYFCNKKTVPALMGAMQTSSNTHQLQSFFSHKAVTTVFLNVNIFSIIWINIHSMYSFSWSSLTNYFAFTNTIWLLNTLLFVCLLIFQGILRVALLNKLIKSLETIWSINLFFALTPLLWITPNITLLFFVLELQMLLFLYLLTTNFATRNTWSIYQYFNFFLFQFWITFLGVVGFVIVILSTSFNFVSSSLIEINMLIPFLNQLSQSWLPFFFLLSVLLFKMGLFPFYFWKPELFRFLPLLTLLVYNFISSFGILIVYINVIKYGWNFNTYFLHWYSIICIFTLLILPSFFFATTEIWSFITFSSINQLNFIVLLFTITAKSSILLGWIFLLNYLCNTFLLFFLFLWTPNFKFLTDFQFLNNKFLIFSFSCFFFNAAGMPPFLGFFTKIGAVSFLFINNIWAIGLLCIINGYIIAYFYWQLIRFIFNKFHTSRLKSLNLLNRFTFFSISGVIFLNCISIFGLHDFYIFSALFI